MKQLIKNIPVVGSLASWGYNRLRGNFQFDNSASYWERRYANGRNSGDGSYNNLAEFKAEVINNFVARNHIESVIEFGCGDGNQLSLANYPNYTGFDVSPTAVSICRQRFSTDPRRKFKLVSDYTGDKADLALSLDVIYHLVEDTVFDSYMQQVFNASLSFVIVYSSNIDSINTGADHVRHRKFTDWVESYKPEWTLLEHVPNRYPFNGDNRTTSFADFYIYKRQF